MFEPAKNFIETIRFRSEPGRLARGPTNSVTEFYAAFTGTTTSD